MPVEQDKPTLGPHSDPAPPGPDPARTGPSGPDPALPLVYAVVPAFNRCEKTMNFLRQFARVNYPNKRVAICDDGSTDHTYHNILLNFPDAEVLRGNGDLWWSGGTNVAIRHALAQGADYILTINDDVHMDPEFLTEMVRVARQDPRHVVGCRIHRQDRPEEIWSIGSVPVFKGFQLYALNLWGRDWKDVEPELVHPLPVPTMAGNGVLIPRAVFEQVGLYDEKHMPHYHADSDLVLRAAKAGYKPVISLKSVLYNHIPTKPLVNTRWGLVFSKKSDRYWKAVWATVRRHGPFGKRLYLLWMQYVPFFTPRWMVKLYHKLPRRAPKADAPPAERAEWRAAEPQDREPRAVEPRGAAPRPAQPRASHQAESAPVRA